MKKLIALLLALVMCLSLCACGEKNDASSTAEESVLALDSDTENEKTAPSDYESEFADILCCDKWVLEDGSDELTFNANGTFSWISDEGIEDWTWSFGAYYNSFSDFPLAVSGDFSEEYCIYLGYAREYDMNNVVVGSDDIVVGYTKEESLIMLFGNQTWIRAE